MFLEEKAGSDRSPSSGQERIEMAFSEIAGHERVKQILGQEVSSGASGTYLFTGPEGVGKMAMAMEFARANLCLVSDTEACDQCSSCMSSSKGNHPDLLIIRPKGVFIKIESLRELSRELTYKPFGGATRIAILEHAEKMRPEAATAMLKTLEEPPPDTVIILVTSHSDALLDTIRSRCKKIAFGRLNQSEVEQILIDEHQRSADDANLLSRISDGSVRMAADLDLDSYLEDRELLVDCLNAENEDSFLLKGLAIVRKFRMKTPERIDNLLGILYGLIRDTAILPTGTSTDLIINVDLLDDLQSLSRKLGQDACQDIAHETARTRTELKQFANKHLLLLALFIRAGRVVFR